VNQEEFVEICGHVNQVTVSEKKKVTFFSPFQMEWLLRVQVRLRYKILHSANIVNFSCFLLISYQATIISLYTFNLFVYNRDGLCLLRGTNWIFKSIVP